MKISLVLQATQMFKQKATYVVINKASHIVIQATKNKASAIGLYPDHEGLPAESS